jgi:membrane associated rhomboid family serine protease
MGLADRDYARDARTSGRPAPRGARVAHRFPAYVILIIVCAAIFVIDMLLPKVEVQASDWQVLQGKEQAFQDLRAAKAPVTLMRDQPNKVGVGYVYVVPGNLPPQVAMSVDPIARAEYMLVSPLRAYLQFTTAKALWSINPADGMQGGEFWRFIGYGFLHVGLSHLVLNMLGLWFFAPIVEDRFGRSRFLAIFFVSTIAGACLYLVLNAMGIAWLKMHGPGSTLAGLLFNDPYTPLIGASGGVYGVILAAAWLRPDAEVLLLFVIPMRLRTLAIGLIALSVLSLLQQGNNAGGEAAHLGGAIAGWWVAQRPHLVDGFFDFFGKRHTSSGTYQRPTTGSSRTAPTTDEIDRILDKVRDKGLSSLSDKERATLRSASDAQQRNSRGGDGRRDGSPNGNGNR